MLLEGDLAYPRLFEERLLIVEGVQLILKRGQEDEEPGYQNVHFRRLVFEEVDHPVLHLLNGRNQAAHWPQVLLKRGPQINLTDISELANGGPVGVDHVAH